MLRRQVLRIEHIAASIFDIVFRKTDERCGSLESRSISGLDLPDINARVIDQGSEIVADSPEHFGAFIKSELAKWTKIVRETGMRLE